MCAIFPKLVEFRPCSHAKSNCNVTVPITQFDGSVHGYATCEHTFSLGKALFTRRRSAFVSDLKNGVYCNKLLCSRLMFAFSRTGWQRSKKNTSADVTCESTLRHFVYIVCRNQRGPTKVRQFFPSFVQKHHKRYLILTFTPWALLISFFLKYLSTGHKLWA